MTKLKSNRYFRDQATNPSYFQIKVPYANLDDLPSFEKYESRRNPRLITGENRDAGKSQWLTLSVVGSLAAIVLTVTLTVFARRIKKGPNVNSGTPIQQMRRFNVRLIFDFHELIEFSRCKILTEM